MIWEKGVFLIGVGIFAYLISHSAIDIVDYVLYGSMLFHQ